MGTRTESLHKSTRNTLGICSINSRELSPEPYNQMQMQLSSNVQIPDGLLAANALLSEKSRLGFRSDDSTLRWGSRVVISSTAIGISGTLYDSRIESRYTGKERDVESGNDYFGARYYASTMGRFMSPDWSGKVEPVPYSKLDDPQTLNLYAYVRNNPLGGVDSNGHEGTAAEATAQAAEDWIFGSTPVQFDGGKKRRPAAQQQPSKQDQVKSAALGAKNLAACTTQFFGSGFNFTLANLPNIDATQNLGGMTIGRTKASMVPDDGVATILIDKGSFSSMKPADLAITYLHETANARAIQQFTQWSGPDFVNGGISRQDRALLGPMGRMPSNGQSHASSGDHDIGNQFERCLNGSPLE